MASRGLKQGALLLAGIGVTALIWYGGPRLLRRMDFFRVRRVEVIGVKYLSTDVVVRALHLTARSNVFDDLGPARRGAASIPGTTLVQVSRRLPGTIRVKVTESVPVALVPRAGRMALIDQRGRELPFDPTRAAPDLPVATEPGAAVARLLARVRDVDPGLYARISSAEAVQGDVLLDLDGLRIWFRPDAPAEVIRAVVAVAQDLVRTRRPYRELDARFAGMVVLRGKAA
jgi:cell division septal protein FtsQ